MRFPPKAYNKDLESAEVCTCSCTCSCTCMCTHGCTRTCYRVEVYCHAQLTLTYQMHSGTTRTKSDTQQKYTQLCICPFAPPFKHRRRKESTNLFWFLCFCACGAFRNVGNVSSRIWSSLKKWLRMMTTASHEADPDFLCRQEAGVSKSYVTHNPLFFSPVWSQRPLLFFIALSINTLCFSNCSVFVGLACKKQTFVSQFFN